MGTRVPFAVLAAGLFALAAGGCVIGVFDDNAPDPLAGGARILWRFQVTANYISHRAAVADDGSVYVNDSSGILWALDPDGALLWSYDGEGSGSQGPTVVGEDGTIYFGTSSKSAIHAVNPDGTQKWVFEDPDTQGLIGGPGVGPDGNVYAVFDTPSALGVVALSPDGDLLWSNLGKPVVHEYGQVGRDVVFGDQQLYWTSERDSRLYAFALNNGDQAVNASLPSPGQADTGKHKKNDVVFVATGIGPRLRAYTANGKQKWEFFDDEPGVTNVLSAPDAAGGHVLINRNLSALYAISSKGEKEWSTASLLEQGPVPGPIVSPTQEVVVIGGQETYGMPGLVKGFDTKSGGIAFEIDIPKLPGGACPVPYARATFTPDGARAYVPAVELCNVPDPPHSYLYAIDTTP